MVYLDNAATTFPKPERVVMACSNFMRNKAANPGRSGHKLSLAAAEEVFSCREAAASLFNAEGPECVAFTANATESLNMALKGDLLNRKNKPNVITSDLEHNSVVRPLEKMSRDGIITYSIAPVNLENDDLTVEAFRSRITQNTVMIAVTHASNVCGKILPIKKLGKLCREYSLKFLVDASQTAGLINIDIKECNIDYLCMPGHKCLYGPMGTGILIAPSGGALETIIEGGTGSVSTDLEQPNFMPDRMESGTVNAPGIAGLREGIAFSKRLRENGGYEKEMKCALALYDRLSEINGVTLYTPRPERGFVPVVSFNLTNTPSSDAAKMLDRYGFALRGGMHCAPLAHTKFSTMPTGMVRASFGAFNIPSESIKLADTVSKLLKISYLDKK